MDPKKRAIGGNLVPQIVVVQQRRETLGYQWTSPKDVEGPQSWSRAQQLRGGEGKEQERILSSLLRFYTRFARACPVRPAPTSFAR